jgi:hypothetical protein
LLAQLQRHLAHDGAQHLRPAANQLESFINVGSVELIGLGQVGVEVLGIRLGKRFPQQRKRPDAGTEERLAFTQHQMSKLVAIGTGKHQVQTTALSFASLVELVPCSLEGKHGVDTLRPSHKLNKISSVSPILVDTPPPVISLQSL